jgi:hypothetical protein
MDFQIIKGAPTDEEIAALAIAIAQIESEQNKGKTADVRKHRWGAPKHRLPQRHGINGWRKASR